MTWRLGVCALLPTGLLFTGCVRHASSASPEYRIVAVATLVQQESHTRSLLQAVSAVNDSAVWVSGHRATWARTTDGGSTGTPGTMSGPASTLQSRDVHAADPNTANLPAAGPSPASRLH